MTKELKTCVGEKIALPTNISGETKYPLAED
jgi:hypothetical protein